MKERKKEKIKKERKNRTEQNRKMTKRENEKKEKRYNEWIQIKEIKEETGKKLPTKRLKKEHTIN